MRDWCFFGLDLGSTHVEFACWAKIEVDSILEEQKTETKKTKDSSCSHLVESGSRAYDSVACKIFLLEFSSPASRSLAFLKFMAILERRYIFQNIIFGIYVQSIHKFQHPKKVFHVADSPGSAVWERFVVLGSASLNLWIPMHRQGNQAPSV